MHRQHIETVRGLERTIEDRNEAFTKVTDQLSRTDQALRSFERECEKLRTRY